jgi:hypothetical protein
MLRQKRSRRHDHAGRTKTALEPASLHECTLEGMQRCVAPSDSFNGRDLATIRINSEEKTRVDGRAVDEHGARAAIACAATLFRSGETERVSQKLQQRLLRANHRVVRLAVDGKSNRLHQRPPFSEGGRASDA